MLDWERFFTQHMIEYLATGANVSRGNLAIHCPFCGSEDPSKHLNVSLKGDGWYCWRNSAHRGVKPHRLIQALLRCSFTEASRLAGDKAKPNLHEDGQFGEAVQALMAPPAKEEAGLQHQTLAFSPELHPLWKAREPSPFLRYLYQERKYENPQQVADIYSLRYAVVGPFRARIIVPIVMRDLGLVNWTARAISGSATLRYRTLSTDPEKSATSGTPVALRPVDSTLLFHDWLWKTDAQTLVVTEGPFDALRVDYLGLKHGVTATCLFGKNLSREQEALLSEVAPRFKRRVLALDRDAGPDSVSLGFRLEALGFKISLVPEGFKDPGECDEMAVLRISGLYGRN